MTKPLIPIFVFLLILASCTGEQTNRPVPDLKISQNQRYFVTDSGKPFFWLGDTAWLLFKNLTRDQAAQYLEDRSEKGFNVIQVMVIQTVRDPTDVYGDSAFYNHNVARPRVTPGNNPDDSLQYDYWDHLDYVIDLAAEKGLYMALIPVWGSNVRSGRVSLEEAKTYAEWLAKRYRERPNIIWLNGGDTRGSDSLRIWNAVGSTLDQTDPGHLISFHPFGRTMTSDWFQDASWLDFHMFQSGHRRYDQDDTERGYGEDNWRYVREVYDRTPIRPVLDGEPSYEGIPQGLHDTTQPYWDDDDVRRYAYWSVFAGAAGFTYGNNAIMQFYRPADTEPAYGAKEYWYEALQDSGAYQLIYLKNLMLSHLYLGRRPDQGLVASGQDEKYNYLIGTRGDDYAMIYTYTGRTMDIAMGRISGEEVEASWYNPRTGEYTSIGIFENIGTHRFDPPGNPKEANDWVLVLTGKS